jgi:2-polyprenyl-3-methyl-5-hydroxy-6-metoxy-1,4-benzoquinol methylase
MVSVAAVWHLSPNFQEHLDRLRHAELDMVREWMKPCKRVLEIGGGSGYLASVLASWGCEITCLDLPGSATGMVRRFPVQEYDGRHLPFPDGQFDVVFSSNVLEHVEALDELLAETRRVLNPDGVAVHLMPSSAWRWWTSVAHYVYVVRIACWVLARLPKSSRETSTGVEQARPEKDIKLRDCWSVIRRAMWADTGVRDQWVLSCADSANSTLLYGVRSPTKMVARHPIASVQNSWIRLSHLRAAAGS